MDARTNRPIPAHIIETLDASLREVADGNLHDAASVQAEARRMLADHERRRPAPSETSPVKRARTA